MPAPQRIPAMSRLSVQPQSGLCRFIEVWMKPHGDPVSRGFRHGPFDCHSGVGAAHLGLKKWRSLPYFTGNEVSSVRLLGAAISPQVLWVLGTIAVAVNDTQISFEVDVWNGFKKAAEQYPKLKVQLFDCKNNPDDSLKAVLDIQNLRPNLVVYFNWVGAGQEMARWCVETRFQRSRSRNKAPQATVAVIGENYVRCNPAANQRIIEKLENLNVAVLVPHLTEWIYYTNWTARLHCRYEKKVPPLLQTPSD
jgi:hypothetical protein